VCVTLPPCSAGMLSDSNLKIPSTQLQLCCVGMCVCKSGSCAGTGQRQQTDSAVVCWHATRHSSTACCSTQCRYFAKTNWHLLLLPQAVLRVTHSPRGDRGGLSVLDSKNCVHQPVNEQGCVATPTTIENFWKA
jgi:hypothetical protein